MSRALTEEEFLGWKSHPVTQEIVRILESKRDTLRRQWEAGSFTDYSKDTTTLVNVGNLGTCRGYAFVAEFTYEDYLSEIDYGEQQRTGATGSGGFDQDV